MYNYNHGDKYMENRNKSKQLIKRKCEVGIRWLFHSDGFSVGFISHRFGY